MPLQNMAFIPFGRERTSTPGVANRSPQRAWKAAPVSGALHPLSPSARESTRALKSCNSVGNAGGSSAASQFVTVTHPFHPHTGQRGVCVARRSNRAGKRWLLRFEDGQTCSIPPQWTDAVTPDPQVAAGGRRGLCSLADLLDLSELVELLMLERGVPGAKACKEKSAAIVREITPQNPWSLR